MTQNEALLALKTGANIFLTGEPGSGKTHTLNTYVEYLRGAGIEPAITASTGIAATHIGGMTIHSWSGIGVKEKLSTYDLEEIQAKERVVKRVQSAKVLVIDEISMLSADVLDSVELVCRKIRRNDEIFGGLQVIFVGDFFQLPPVNKNDFGGSKKFAFQSDTWGKLKPLVCYLSEQYRQKDKSFLSTLTTIRAGSITPELKEFLQQRVFTELPDADITKLYPHNADVDRLNSDQLSLIEEESSVFIMHGKGAPFLVESLKKSCLSPERLFLKIGARVMFTKNSFDQSYVNGTVGEVVDYGKSGFPIVKIKTGKKIEVERVEWSVTDGNKVLASISQIPLRLAWAITVHKSQGMSLDAAVIDLRSAFEYGQGYVALSRVRSFSGLYLLGFNDKALEVHPEVQLFDSSLRALSDEVKDAFSALGIDEVKKMHENFLHAIGGISSGARVKKKVVKENTYSETYKLLLDGISLEEIAKKRNLTIGTILTHLDKLIDNKSLDLIKDLKHLKPSGKKLQKISKVRGDDNSIKLKELYTKLNGEYTYEEIKIALLFLKKSHE